MPRKDAEAGRQYQRWYAKNKRDPARTRKANREYARQRRAANPELAKKVRRQFTLKQMGLTAAQFRGMLKFQGNKCAIGREVFTVDNPPYIDHDHNCCPKNSACSKCIRGLLCRKCNLGLGYFSDNPDTILKAVSYLMRRK